jgi:colanic acid/amylovoran biosynthesis glycosyltransferase
MFFRGVCRRHERRNPGLALPSQHLLSAQPRAFRDIAHYAGGRMKVTFCSYNVRNHVAGPDAWLRRLLPELRRRGIDSELLLITDSPADDCPTVHWARDNGFGCSSTRRPRYTEDGVRWFLKKVRESQPDVFVVNFILAAYYAGRWIHAAGIPTVGVMHSDEPYYHELVDEFVCGGSEFRLSALVCVSQFLEQKVLDRQTGGIVIRRIPCGTPLATPVSSFSGGRLRLAYVGRLVEQQKRISEVTRALCRVVRDVPNTEAVLYGDGPDRAKVEDILRNEGASLPIRLEGLVPSEEIQDHLLRCHALVLLSDYEGLPIALMEAMSCGVVPICLRIRSGVTELVEDGVTGLLVDDRGDGFVAAVRRLAENEQSWQRLSQNARHKVCRDYSNEFCASRWEELFRELKAKAGAAGLPRIPIWLRLPPAKFHLAVRDRRRPPWHRSLLGKGRGMAGKVKRKLIGTLH